MNTTTTTAASEKNSNAGTELCEFYCDLILNEWVEVSEEFYDEALCVLPPNFLKYPYLWQVDECCKDDLYHTFCQVGNQYYGTLCCADWAIKSEQITDFLKITRRQANSFKLY